MKKRAGRLFIALSIAILVTVLLVIFYNMTYVAGEKSIINRILIALGGNIVGGGYIQFLTYFVFFWGIIEISALLSRIKYEERFFNADLLPREEHQILNANDVNSIRIKVLHYLETKKTYDDNHKYYLPTIVKKVCTKFRSNQSVPEAMEVLTAQSRINTSKADSEQSYIRYFAWAIPSIGFIGTVLGILQALGYANTNDLDLITGSLGLAFDTTLIALILSIFLMWLIHDLQEKTEQLHSDIEEYVLENLINKIDTN